jgi:hypothetical protein
MGMITYEQFINTLDNPHLTLEIAIVVGIALIIISVAQPSGIPILNIPLNLNRNRSIILAVIGCALILSGFSGLIVLSNSAPKFVVTDLHPDRVTALTNGTMVYIYAEAVDPDTNNKIQQSLYKLLFSKMPPLQYEFSYEGPSTNNSIIHIKGPEASSNCTFWVYPHYAGKNTILINVTDCPPGDMNAKSATAFRFLDIIMPSGH